MLRWARDNSVVWNAIQEAQPTTIDLKELMESHYQPQWLGKGGFDLYPVYDRENTFRYLLTRPLETSRSQFEYQLELSIEQQGWHYKNFSLCAWGVTMKDCFLLLMPAHFSIPLIRALTSNPWSRG